MVIKKEDTNATKQTDNHIYSELKEIGKEVQKHSVQIASQNVHMETTAYALKKLSYSFH